MKGSAGKKGERGAREVSGRERREGEVGGGTGDIIGHSTCCIDVGIT